MLNSQNIIQLPEEIIRMKNLRGIYLESNRQLNLTDLFIKLSKLKSLKELDLAHCSIVELPKEIGLLQNLKVLEIGANNFTSLPNEIKTLQKLRELIFTQGSYESFYSLPLEAKKDLIRSLPKCKILLRENRPRGPVHGEYTLGKKSVRVTLKNVNLFTNSSIFLDSH